MSRGVCWTPLLDDTELLAGNPGVGMSAQVTGPEGSAMTRAGTGSQAPPGAVSAPASRADTCIRAAAGVTVAGLASIAGAISYSHMTLTVPRPS
jgi:hypothetical protein